MGRKYTVVSRQTKITPVPDEARVLSATGAFTTRTPLSSQLTCTPARNPLSTERLYPALRTRRVRVTFFVQPAGDRMQNRRSSQKNDAVSCGLTVSASYNVTQTSQGEAHDCGETLERFSAGIAE